ncbi:uncharacterized protein LOC116205067 [Punica granatum]|uniref:Uncharacterized protein LOC116205067 n=1 Tax=Punica granatum TaxID=22663 RepID=A0A6P8DJ58_PUNGR|nr:uncharacterized protein LOC116205067 [Punica granatum]
MVISSDEDEGYISKELVDKCISDDEKSEEEFRKYPEFDENATFGEVQLQLNMLFPNLIMFKKAVADYNIAVGRVFKFVKNDNERVRTKCRSDGCKWEIFCSWSNEVKTFKVKKFVEPHTCARGFKNKQANKKWLAIQLVDELRSYPTMSAHDAFEWFKRYRGIHVDEHMLYRAMRLARTIVEGSEKLQYQKLWDYCEELRRHNPNSTFGLQVNRPTLELPPTFDRLYICFNANVQGFKAGCRPLIGLDGCFRKGYYGGQLLSAVAQDGNQHFYVIAIAVVEQESRDTWSWFLRNLLGDIGQYSDNGWNFISDQQKGLKLALEELCPGAPHRNCVLHIWRNFYSKYKNMELTKQLWKCARNTTMVEFDQNMMIMKRMNEDAWAWLKRFKPDAWSKAGFSDYPKNDNLLNNTCEQFNSKIVKFRGKPIITMLEEIRCYLMGKMNKHRLRANSFVGPICPVAQSRLDKCRKDSSYWTPEWVGDAAGYKFQVWKRPQCKVVDLGAGTCSCRMWQLTGIPCAHAIACMAYNNLEPEKYVHSWYSTERWRATYVPYIEPITGENDWHLTELPPIEPPAFKRPSGRPKQRKRQSEGETSNSSKATRKYGETHCSRCGEAGHNVRRCTKEANNDAPNKRGNRRTTGGSNASDSQVEPPLGPSGPIVGSQDSIILGSSVPVSASHSFAQVQRRPFSSGMGIPANQGPNWRPPTPFNQSPSPSTFPFRLHAALMGRSNWSSHTYRPPPIRPRVLPQVSTASASTSHSSSSQGSNTISRRT